MEIIQQPLRGNRLPAVNGLDKMHQEGIQKFKQTVGIEACFVMRQEHPLEFPKHILRLHVLQRRIDAGQDRRIGRGTAAAGSPADHAGGLGNVLLYAAPEQLDHLIYGIVAHFQDLVVYGCKSRRVGSGKGRVIKACHQDILPDLQAVPREGFVTAYGHGIICENDGFQIRIPDQKAVDHVFAEFGEISVNHASRIILDAVLLQYLAVDGETLLGVIIFLTAADESDLRLAVGEDMLHFLPHAGPAVGIKGGVTLHRDLKGQDRYIKLTEERMNVIHGQEASDGTDGHDQGVQCLLGSIVENGIVLIIILRVDRIVVRRIQIHAREDDQIHIRLPRSIFHALTDLERVVVIEMTREKTDIQSMIRFHRYLPP